jgi:mRNA interferase MazF
LSTGTFLVANGHGLFAMITSARHSAWPSDIELAGWREAGLPKPSKLRWKVFTLPASHVLAVLGILQRADAAEAEQALTGILGLAPHSPLPVSAAKPRAGS